jgi:N-acetylglucosamine-6-sulfatase
MRGKREERYRGEQRSGAGRKLHRSRYERMVQSLRGERTKQKVTPVLKRGEKGRIVRRVHRRLVLFALLSLLAGLGMTASHPESSLAQTASKPNIVFILTDDMKQRDLSLRYMPNTQSLLANQGVEFTKAYVTRSLCCPSRASTLRGQYTHNHKVWVNVNPTGGFWNFYDLGHETSTIATWLDDPNNFADRVDYDTVLIGKYLNRYGLDRSGNYAPTPHVPPGWDEWYAWEGQYYSDTTYDINENGRIVRYQRSLKHDTDLHRDTAVDFIRRTAGGAPFFMYLAPNAPHHPAYYASRHADMFSSESLPKPQSFNEADVSDKPAWVQNKPRLSSTKIQELTTFNRKRLRALQSVDDMVGKLVDTLSAVRDPLTQEPLINNTYIVFTSDNGIYLGEHRLTEKAAAYQAAPRVPLVIRGPGVPQGVTRSQMALNNDLAPTFASWAGVTPPSFVDGRSLKPVLSGSPSASWRNAFLVEHRSSLEEFGYVKAIPNYDALRTIQYSYVEYATGEKELYDLTADPQELTSIHASASPELLSSLALRLDELRRCAGTGQTQPSSPPTCEAAEGR